MRKDYLKKAVFTINIIRRAKMYVVISELPDDILNLFKQADAFESESKELYELATSFANYLRDTALLGIEDDLIDKEELLIHNSQVIFEDFICLKERVKEKFRNSAITQNKEDRLFYKSIHVELEKAEKIKGRLLTANEVHEVEENYINSLLTYNDDVALIEQIYNACGRILHFSYSPYIEPICFYKKREDRVDRTFLSFKHNNKTFEIEKFDLDGGKKSKDALSLLPSEIPVPNKQDYYWECYIDEPGFYIDEFNVDISGIDICNVNIYNIRNINYILLFLKTYKNLEYKNYIATRNIAILENKLSKRLRETELELGEHYIESILENISKESGNITFSEDTYTCFKRLFGVEIAKPENRRNNEELLTLVANDNGDEWLWGFICNLIEENNHLFTIKAKSKVGQENYEFWKKRGVNKISLLNLKAIKSYGVVVEDGAYINVHGVSIKKDKWRNYKRMISTLKFLHLHFSNTFNRISDYHAVLKNYNFWSVYCSVNEQLYLEAKNVINDSAYMVNAFITYDDFEDCYNRLKIISKHISSLDSKTATVDDFYINWDEIKEIL